MVGGRRSVGRYCRHRQFSVRLSGGGPGPHVGLCAFHERGQQGQDPVDPLSGKHGQWSCRAGKRALRALASRVFVREHIFLRGIWARIFLHIVVLGM